MKCGAKKIAQSAVSVGLKDTSSLDSLPFEENKPLGREQAFLFPSSLM